MIDIIVAPSTSVSHIQRLAKTHRIQPLVEDAYEHAGLNNINTIYCSYCFRAYCFTFSCIIETTRVLGRVLIEKRELV
jgi:hypothetical protein